VFNLAMRKFKEALKFYIFDGFVTEHVNVMMDISMLFKDLTAFEPDPKRKVNRSRYG
jgi:hypothetical protein